MGFISALNRQEKMSQINGDKSRFNRERKQNIHRRLRTRELLEAAGQHVPASAGNAGIDGKKSGGKKIKVAPEK